MKLTFYYCFLLLILLGCKDDQTVENKTITIDYFQFFKFDLSSFDIPATIMLPDETVGIGASFLPEVKHKEADFLWELNIGPYFSFLIEDYGDVKELVKTHKAKILDKQQSIYTMKLVVDEPELLIYERRLKTARKQNSEVTYHAYAQKNINGIYYEFKSPEAGHSKKVIDIIEKTFRSINAIK